MGKDKTFKASHFENIQELINTCKVWIRDDDYDAYCRFFDMGAMEELLNELDTLQNGFNTAGEHQSELIRENSHFRYELFNNQKELEKKNKIIDAMANEWFELDTVFMVRGKNVHNVEELKQYFERKVKDE